MVQKSIVLDFDHTIGYFTQMVFIINTIEVTHDMELSESDFHILFHHYPHIFRPKLYTRNNLQRFVEAIVSYLESKLKHHELFQFKIYEKTKFKNMNTIQSHISNIQNHILCFIDNTYFSYDIKEEGTKYIKCEKYIYDYKTSEIVQRFPYFHFLKIDQTLLNDYLVLQKHRNKKKKKKQKYLPHGLYELHSSFIYQSIRDFVS
jgi:hypothetical protein